jgi:hypothetical protein
MRFKDATGKEDTQADMLSGDPSRRCMWYVYLQSMSSEREQRNRASAPESFVYRLEQEQRL